MRLINVFLILFGFIASTAATGEDTDQWNNPDLSVYDDLPITVKVGVHVDQITHVDQRAENFGAVGDIRIEWQDANLEFTPENQALPVRRFSGAAFAQKSDTENIFFPAFTIFNQQGRRFSEEAGVVVFPDGRAVYGERFSATLQAPDFDFEGYPFDSQRFFITIDTQWPNWVMQFAKDSRYWGLGDQLGEEEWVFEAPGAEISTRDGIFGQPTSRITFSFEAHRHVWYYILRIFIPLLIIVLVSWTTFFLADFAKRVDISGGNLLVFIAFNFTISNDLPRLGYLTFMDTIMAATFIITGLTVAWNVILRRLEVVGRERLARTVDAYTLWVYPVAFLIVIYLSLLAFFPNWEPGHLFNLL